MRPPAVDVGCPGGSVRLKMGPCSKSPLNASARLRTRAPSRVSRKQRHPVLASISLPNSNRAPSRTVLIGSNFVITMSDYEDEMDVDAPIANDEIKFGGEQAKGKRSAANLPVEAEDSLPW